MSLHSELQALGLARGDLVMVHASMRRVGGRAEDLVAALLAVLGPEGTLAAYVDFEPTEATPYFDPDRSPAVSDHGVLAEVIRRWPGARRSLNPGASMAAVGGRADWLTRNHAMNYGYGLESPLAKLVDDGGKVLLLGSDFDHVTLLHHAEHLARLPNKRVITSTIDTQNGEVAIEEFDTSAPVVAAMPENYFEVVTQAFVDKGLARNGKVGGANSFVFSAAEFIRFSVSKMEVEFG